jgi:hypothetical protein
MNDRTTFGDRLLAVEPLSPDFRETLQKELHMMFVRQLSASRRMVIGALALVALASAVICGSLAVTETELPTLPRVGLGVGTLFGLAWMLVLGRIARRGAIDLRIDNRLMAAMVWVFTVLMMVFFLMVGMSIEDRLKGLLMIANGLAFLVGAGVYFLAFRIEQAELSVREKLLELELRLAELSEKGTAR